MLIPEGALGEGSDYAGLLGALDLPRSTLPDWRFDRDEARRALSEHFGVARLDGFGVADLGVALGAAGAVLHYLQDTQKGALRHITRLSRVAREDCLILDRTTRASLELDPRRCATASARDRCSGSWTGPRPRWAGDSSSAGCWSRFGSSRRSPRGRAASASCVTSVLSAKVCGLIFARSRTSSASWPASPAGAPRPASWSASARASAVLPELRELLGAVYSRILLDLADELPDLGDLVDLLTRALATRCRPRSGTAG